MSTDNDATALPPPPPADESALPPGYRIHEYEIEKPLGGGGFGITYLAHDINLDLPVAIKEYFPSDQVMRGADNHVQVRTSKTGAQASYDWGLERFLDEARALATFRHPNIVRVLRYFRMNGTAYIVMEYESGQSLKRWLPHNSPLTQRAMLSVVLPLLDGLEAVHKTGFLHRDIKPDNIYVRADGTPVLLDFGAARRVSADHEMTNIVSPGFAPFEQYHSQGKQGPWTDIYSLGAVMYWMVTGKKPMESVSRAAKDTLAPASSLADVSIYGHPLLDAIGWALRPDETRRPQTVREMRVAIQGSGPVTPDFAMPELVVVPGAPASAPLTGGAGASEPVSGPPSGAPSGPSASRRGNLLCTIMFLDLVGYSIRSVDDQVTLKKLFNELIGKALKGVAEDTRIAIDTGDGAAICFLGDPEEALQSALLLRDLLGQRYGTMLSVRIGLHLGPVRVINDINDRVNVVGDGINVAARVMDFAQGNQVLVSRAYYDVLSRITDDTAGLFRSLGGYEDKHGRVHEVYAVDGQQHSGETTRVGPSTGYTKTQPVRSIQNLSPEAVHDMETELARHIGPLAKVLVRKAQPMATSLEGLREALAPLIPEPRARESFLAGPDTHAPSHSQPVSRPSGATYRSGPASAAPSSQSMPLSSRSIPLGPTHRMVGNTSRQLDLTPEEVTAVELALSKFIGPMAKMLVKRDLGRHSTYADFAIAVAKNVDQTPQREAFLAALRKALPQRPF